MIPSNEGIMFECSSSPKVIRISGDMSLATVGKTNFVANEGCKILINVFFFYHQPIYLGDGCVEYDCMKFKCDVDVGKMFFIYSKFSTKGLIELNKTFAHSSYEILALLLKSRKPRKTYEIIVLLYDEYV